MGLSYLHARMGAIRMSTGMGAELIKLRMMGPEIRMSTRMGSEHRMTRGMGSIA